MKIALALIVSAFLMAVVVFFAARPKPAPQPTPAPTADKPNSSVLFEATASESKERVKQTGLSSEGSQNMKHLLVPPALESNAELDRRPYEVVSWIMDVEFEGDPALEYSRLRKLSLYEPKWWTAQGRPDIFGWSPDIKHWTYFSSPDSPPTFTKLCFGWTLDPSEEIRREDLERYKQAILEKLAEFGTPKAKTNYTAEEAVEVAAKIKRLVKEYDQYLVVLLAAPRGKSFEGRDIWDVMKCLGLEWGDGDLFHWQNESGLGDDAFFSVETTTPPGYFFPEEIAAGRVQVADLLFAFSIPRSAAPEKVFDSMMAAIRYAQKRLGGTLLDQSGKPLDENAARTDIKNVVEQLQQHGLKPGTNSVLRVF